MNALNKYEECVVKLHACYPEDDYDIRERLADLYILLTGSEYKLACDLEKDLLLLTGDELFIESETPHSLPEMMQIIDCPFEALEFAREPCDCSVCFLAWYRGYCYMKIGFYTAAYEFMKCAWRISPWNIILFSYMLRTWLLRTKTKFTGDKTHD